MEKVQKAIELAVKYHAGQYRKEHVNIGSKVPFIVHPMQVMKLVYDWGAGTADNLAAAVCHDLLEDTKVSPEDLMSAVETKAFNLVSLLTNPEKPELSKVEKAKRKAEYLAGFAKLPVDALIIKLADRYCNVYDFIHCGDHHYASKYSGKASSLYDAFDVRIDEIAQTYGQGTVAKIHECVEDLRQIAANFRQGV